MPQCPAPRLGALALIRVSFRRWIQPVVGSQYTLSRPHMGSTAIYLIIKSSKHALFLLTFRHPAHKPELNSGDRLVRFKFEFSSVSFGTCHPPAGSQPLVSAIQPYARAYLFSATPFLRNRQVGVCIVGVTPIQVMRIQFRLSFSKKSSPFTVPLRAVSSVSRRASSDLYQLSPRVAVLSSARLVGV